ncbi:hypothetical protein RQP46_009556 [Phenoliferia psychrophenolica]
MLRPWSLAPALLTLLRITGIRADGSDCLASLYGSVNASSAYFVGDYTAYNLRLQPIPAAVFYPTSPADISSAILCAQSAGLAVAVRSGGHSYASYSIGGTDGSLVIDLGAFRSIVVHDDNTASIGGGAKLGNIALALSYSERAIPHGTCPTVGVGGHTTGGGFGEPGRMWGLMLDNVVGMDVVMANGTIVSGLTRDLDGDLFFAILGCGSSFAVVTSFRFKTYAMPQAVTHYGFTYDSGILDSSGIAQVFSAYQTIGAGDVVPELGMGFQVGTGGSCFISGNFYGSDQGALDGILQPLKDLLPGGYKEDKTPMSWIGSVVNYAGTGPLNTTGVPDIHDTFFAKSIITPSGSPIPASVMESFFDYLADTQTSTYWFGEIHPSLRQL